MNMKKRKRKQLVMMGKIIFNQYALELLAHKHR